MEFQVDPQRIPTSYATRVAEILSWSSVGSNDFFDNSGIFSIFPLGSKMYRQTSTKMWAGDLLGFSRGTDGVRATRAGTLHVYNGRMERQKVDPITPVHTIYPVNIRVVDPGGSYKTCVGESGWVFDQRSARSQRFNRENPISDKRLIEMLVEAEGGRTPPVFMKSRFTKIEPESVGREVHVIRFDNGDEIVVDPEARRLVGRSTVRLLSRERWEKTGVLA